MIHRNSFHLCLGILASLAVSGVGHAAEQLKIVDTTPGKPPSDAIVLFDQNTAYTDKIRASILDGLRPALSCKTTTAARCGFATSGSDRWTTRRSYFRSGRELVKGVDDGWRKSSMDLYGLRVRSSWRRTTRCLPGLRGSPRAFRAAGRDSAACRRACGEPVAVPGLRVRPYRRSAAQ